MAFNTSYWTYTAMQQYGPPPPMSPYGYGGQSPYGNSYGYGGQNPYGDPYAYGGPSGFGGPGGFGGQQPMQMPQQDQSAGMMAFMNQFFAMIMNTLRTGIGIGNMLPPQTQIPPQTQDPTQMPDPTQTQDPNADLDTNSNTDIMKIVANNQKNIHHTNGRITQKNLKDFLTQNPDLPDSTKAAVQNLIDNPELYNLLCLKGGTTPDEGFRDDALKTDDLGKNLDVDHLETVPDDKVWDTLKSVSDNLNNIDGNKDNGVTLDEIKKVALGQVDDPKLKDPKVQAAALKFMLNDELKKKFDSKTGDAGDGVGTISGDPHFVGDDGEHYDVMGQAGKTYNILSDKDIQFNAQFQAYGNNGATTIGKAGIQVNQHKVELDAGADAPTVDGKKLEKDKPMDLGNGSTVTWDGTSMKLSTPDYDVTVTENHDGNGNYLDQTIKAKNPYADGVNPHGLWGQTVDKDKAQKNTGHDQGNQGGTVIDGSVGDYETDGLWGTSHNTDYNRFDPNATTDISNDGQGGF